MKDGKLTFEEARELAEKLAMRSWLIDDDEVGPTDAELECMAREKIDTLIDTKPSCEGSPPRMPAMRHRVVDGRRDMGEVEHDEEDPNPPIDIKAYWRCKVCGTLLPPDQKKYYPGHRCPECRGK